MTAVQRRNRLGFLAMAGGTFMAVLDTQIVSSSLPRIAASLGATMAEASWIQTAYMSAEVIMIPLAGWLSRALSLRYLYALAALLFTLASLSCALAWSMDALILVRILQGACSGIVTPLLYQGIYLLLPRERQAGATIFAVMIISLAPVVGPTLGGWIADTWSWRWLFFINLLPGLVVAGSVYHLLRGPEPELALLRGHDLPGILLVALFLGALEYVLAQGPDLDWFASGKIAGFAALSAGGLLLLIRRELVCPHPVVELRAFGSRNFSLGCLFNFAMGVGLFGSGYLMTLFLAGIKRYDSMEIGRVMAVPGVAMLVSVPVARALRARFGGMFSLLAGLLMFCVALGLNGAMTAQTAYRELFLPQVLRGMGIIFCLAPITEIALGALPAAALPNATGLYTLMRSLGGGVGIALINILVAGRVALHHHRLAESLHPAQVEEFLSRVSAVNGGGVADSDQALQQGTRLLGQLVNREAQVMAYNDLWGGVAVVFIGILFLLPLVRRAESRPAERGPAAPETALPGRGTPSAR